MGNVGPRCRERDGSAPHPKAGRGMGDTKGLGSASRPAPRPTAAPRHGGSTEAGLRGEPRYRASSARVVSARRSAGWNRGAPSIPWAPPARPGRPELSPTQPRAAPRHERCARVRVCAHTHGVRDHACAPCPARAPHPPSAPIPQQSRPTPGSRSSPCRGNAIRAGGRRGPSNSVTRSPAPPPIHYSAAPSPRRGAVTNRAALIQLRPPPPAAPSARRFAHGNCLQMNFPLIRGTARCEIKLSAAGARGAVSGERRGRARCRAGGETRQLPAINAVRPRVPPPRSGALMRAGGPRGSPSGCRLMMDSLTL